MTKKITSSKKKPPKTASDVIKTKITKKAAEKKPANATKESLPKKAKASPKKPTVTSSATHQAIHPNKSVSKEVPENRGVLRQTFIKEPKRTNNPVVLTPFLTKQRQRLLQLKDTLLDSMKGVARDNLHSGSDASAFGMHQADAGSDAYDRDFSLSILSQEQNSLYEIDEALKRIDDGAYGVCEVSNKAIPRARLEALPFTRFTVECQAELEKRHHFLGARLPVSSLFGLTEEESENDDDENIIENTKD